MSNQIERILICLLWLVAATLGASFWLNTFFGFNIFSAQHWQYLSYLQATQAHIRTSFYISLSMAAIICVVVLYILMRPRTALQRLRHLRTVVTPANRAHDTPIPETASPAAPAAPAPARSPRPARPNAPTLSPHQTFSPPPTGAQSAKTNKISDSDFKELREIFKSGGYVVKHSPQIGNFKPAVLAIGTNEILWIGGIGVSADTVEKAVEKMSTLFADTLDDIEIIINAFIVSPAGPNDNTNILTFPDIDSLREYMRGHQNPPVEDAEGGKENFDAYSEYIDTVITYMDKT